MATDLSREECDEAQCNWVAASQSIHLYMMDSTKPFFKARRRIKRDPHPLQSNITVRLDVHGRYTQYSHTSLFCYPIRYVLRNIVTRLRFWALTLFSQKLSQSFLLCWKRHEDREVCSHRIRLNKKVISPDSMCNLREKQTKTSSSTIVWSLEEGSN